ncbi:patellin-3-like [Olea europaea var. sylvestris]|uniref:patellin-3-like n=1 Tax=Olea europaea var. sylvestris TaxID=158386 RepID=UPI000C1D223C|nr:patellin-3-like [Olea europaea var. sylvestris]
MAEEVKKTAQEQSKCVESEEVAVVTDVPEPEKPTMEESLLVPEPEFPLHSNACDESVNLETLMIVENDEKPPQADAVKKEITINASSKLSENEKKALEELKQLVREALNRHEFGISSSPKEETKPVMVEEEKKPINVEPEVEKDSKEEIEKDSIPEDLIEENEKTVVDDDGAKTLEAIEETIVAIPAPIPSEEKPQDTVNLCNANSPQSSLNQVDELYIWGVKLLEDEKSDVILLKFLRARDFKVKDAFSMIKNTLRWRKEFGIDQLLEEDFGSDLERVVFMHGCSKEGNPVCYNVYGEFQNKELYQRTFSDEQKRQKFLRWRIQFLEKSIRKLDFSPCGVSTIIQVNDLKNSPGPNKWELRQATKQALQLFQDNYPEFVAKQVFINVPWWYLALNKMISPFLTQRTKSKFVVAGPSRSTETLFKYIAAEQVPTQYGGLSKDGDFGTADSVTEIILKPSAKHIVEFPVNQACLASWEITVVGWEVSYGAEFAPSAEDEYTVIIQKMRKIHSTQDQEHVISDSFKVEEPGKVALTIDNPTSKKKKILYRFKTKLSFE